MRTTIQPGTEVRLEHSVRGLDRGILALLLYYDDEQAVLSLPAGGDPAWPAFVSVAGDLIAPAA